MRVVAEDDDSDLRVEEPHVQPRDDGAQEREQVPPVAAADGPGGIQEETEVQQVAGWGDSWQMIIY